MQSTISVLIYASTGKFEFNLHSGFFMATECKNVSVRKLLQMKWNNTNQ